MSFKEKFLKFCNRNIVMITGIPLIIGIHWTWLRLQDIPELVPPNKKKELPVVIGAQYIAHKIEDEYNTITHKDTSQK